MWGMVQGACECVPMVRCRVYFAAGNHADKGHGGREALGRYFSVALGNAFLLGRGRPAFRLPS